MSAHHPDDMTLMNYSAGSLSAPQALAISMHLCFCHHCRLQVKKFDNLGGALLESITPASSDGAELEALMARLEPRQADAHEASTLAPQSHSTEPGKSQPAHYRNPLQPYLPGPLQELPWQRQSSEISMFDLSRLINDKGFQVRLQKIKAGARVPKHTHKGFEYTVVLTGGFSDELGVYHSGDFIARDSQHCHSPTALQNEDCICLTVLNAPLKFTGWQRVFNPFMGWR